MKRHVRIRCPICGMLTWQSRLDKEFRFEILVQEIESRGQGRISNKYYSPEEEEGVFLIKMALADKLETVARELRSEARSEKDGMFWESLRTGDTSKYWDLLGASSGIRKAVVVEKLSGESVVVLAEPEEPVENKALLSRPASIIRRASRSLWRPIRTQKPAVMSSDAEIDEEEDDIAEAEMTARFTGPVQPMLFGTGGRVRLPTSQETTESESDVKEGGEEDHEIRSENEIV